MAYLHRLIFALLLCVCGGAYASFPATQTNTSACTVAPCYVYKTYAPNGYLVGTYSTLQAAKDEVTTRLAQGGAVEGGPQYFNYRTSSGYLYTNIMIRYDGGAPVAAVYSCPANATLSGSTCTCNAGLMQSGSSCADINNCPKAGTVAGRWERPYVAGRGISDPYLICDGATPAGSPDGALCVVSIVGDMAVGSPPVVYGQATFTGAKSANCTGDGGSGATPGSGNSTPPVQGQPAPTPCKAGYAPGSVNGVTACYPAGSDGKPVTTPSTGSTTTSVDGNTPTSTGITSSTECALGRCTTTTSTTTTVNGTSSTTTSTKTESQGDYCKENPRSMQCVTSSWGGSCSASFTCDGDAVMCAISKEQHIRNCKLFDDVSSTEAQLYGSEKGKTGSQTSSLPGSQSIAISSGSFDTSDAIGGGTGCIADKSVTVAGSVISIPFSTVCGHLAMLGNILLAVSFLLAGRIVVRG